jgi:hypothetical protein
VSRTLSKLLPEQALRTALSLSTDRSSGVIGDLGRLHVPHRALLDLAVADCPLVEGQEASVAVLAVADL